MENNERFVPIKAIEESNGNWCKVCGDTKPKHGFYPLYSMAYGAGTNQTNWLTCNRCARTDENYEEIFGEKKEVFK